MPLVTRGVNPEAFDVLYERTGAQTRAQVETLQHALPLKRVHLVGRKAARTQERAAAFEATRGLEVLAFSSITEGLRGAPLVVTRARRHVPPAREPVFTPVTSTPVTSTPISSSPRSAPTARVSRGSPSS